MKTIFSIGFALTLIFASDSINAQELHTHSNAASINNEANSVSGWGGSATRTVSTTETYSGSYSIKLEAPNTGWNYAGYGFTSVANQEYLVSIYAKSDTTDDPRIYYTGDLVSTSSTQITDTNWAVYTKTIEATGTNININVYPGTPATNGGVIYIDHISITPVNGTDTQAPTAPTLSNTAQTDITVDLSWSGATDNVGVTEYKVYRDNSLITTLGNVNTYQVTGLTAATTYSFAVRALDAAGNQSLASNLSVTTDASSGGGDTQSPSAPTNLSSPVNTDTTADLSWNAATDNVGVTNYKIFKDGNLEATLNNVTTYQVTGLTASTAYSFTVSALDAANNESPASSALAFTTDVSSGGGSGSSVWLESNSVASYSGNVAIGTTAVPSDYKMAIDGKLITEEVKVQLSGNWPDYVFEEGYDLPSLEEIQKHINEKGYLPNIPSAREVKANGIELGEMDRLLLEKIEELTLHTIKQHELIQKQQKQIQNLQKEVSNLIKNHN